MAGLAIVSAQTALANPNGGNVVAGSATINGQGTDRVRIDQASDRVIINWDNFSIGAGQGVDFRQPNARSIALNRVTGPEISQIMGELTANGQVYLINGNGIVFGKDARVDVAGLVATSADIGNDAFMAGGALRFGTPGRAGAKVINHGTITVRDAGMAAFVAPQVANDGIITAHVGRIAFGGAQAFTLDLHGDNLIRFQVGDAVRQLDDKGALVDIGGVVDARGGSLLITASAARDLVNQSVRIGTPQAASMAIGADGKVSLIAAKVTVAAPGEVQVHKNVAMDLSSATNGVATGGRPGKKGANSNIGWASVVDGDGNVVPGEAMAASGTGGTLTISAARTILDGTINLDGSTAGGTAQITGSDFLSFGALLSASGAEAGGNIQLDAGGFSLAGRIVVNAGLGKGGSVDIHATRRAIDTGEAFIDASGLHGGSIRYTSDQQIISSGKFRASGSHGFGGTIDVSADRLDLFSSQFYAQGGIRGGRVRLGGEFQGGKNLSVDELMNARTLVATDAVTIDVSAVGMRGNAGEIVIWSDEKTTFLGRAIARGGLVGGVGGQIEISGKETLVYRGTVETARDGQRGGKLLLDPKNIIIAEGVNAPSQYGLVLQAFASNFPPQVTPEPGLKANDGFGAVSLDGNRLAVGASGDDGADTMATDAGAVYLFSFADAAFAAPTLEAMIGRGYSGGKNISINALEAGDEFGRQLSLDGTRLAVGAVGDNGANNDPALIGAGAVYLFMFSDLAFNSGTLRGVLGVGYSGPASLDVPDLEGEDLFGFSLSIDANRLAVGAIFDDGAGGSTINNGAVYLFTFSDSEFSNPVLQARIGEDYGTLGGNNVSLSLGGNNRYIGWATSLDGNRLAVGVPRDTGEGNVGFSHGAVYLFSFADAAFSTPVLESRIGLAYSGPKDLALPDLAASDHFGESLTLEGNRLAVVAALDDGLGDAFTDTGVVYLFTFEDAAFSAPRLSARIGANYANITNRDMSVTGFDPTDRINSVSMDGNRLAIGVSNDDGRNNTLTDAGAVYLFTFEDAAFNNGRQVGTLGAGYTGFTGVSLLGDGLEEFDGFGTSVSLDGNRLAVGARFDDGAGNAKIDVGAVYLFTFGDAQFSAPVLQSIIGSGYTGGKNLSVSRLATDDLFGTSVSLNGLRLAVGAPGDDGVNDNSSEAGAVYLFTFADAAFGFGNLARVLDFESINDALGGPISADASELGSAVSLSGNFIAVGAAADPGFGGSEPESGVVHIFDLGDASFTSLPNRLVTIGLGFTGPNDINMSGLGPGNGGPERFGSAVALDGLNLAVGSPGDDGFDNDFSDTGAVHLFTFGAGYTGGSLVSTFGRGYTSISDLDVTNIGADNDRFGTSVALDGRQLAVGAIGDDGLGNLQNNAGAVYLFTFGGPNLTSASQVGIIGANYLGPANFDLKLSKGSGFGAAVALDNNRLVVGSPNDPGRGRSAPGSGAVHLFAFADGQFANARLVDTLGAGYSGQRNLSLSALGENSAFGTSVSLDGLRLAVGAPGDNGANDTLGDVGAVFLFSFADLAFAAPVLEAVIGRDYSSGKNIALANLEADDRFGSAVSLSGLQLAVGASGDQGSGNLSGTRTGAVYLFTFTDLQFGGGALEATIGSGYTGIKDMSLANIEANDDFGRSVSLDQNRLAVGAPGDDGDGEAVTDAGAVYLFSFTDAFFGGGVAEGIIGSGYSGLKSLGVVVGSTPLEVGSFFGSSVALKETDLIVGAPGDNGFNDDLIFGGAVYAFGFTDLAFDSPTLNNVIGSGYTESQDTDIANIGDLDGFGSSVAFDGRRLVIGATGDGGADNSLTDAGAVYLLQFGDTAYVHLGTIGAGYGEDTDLPLGRIDESDFFGSAVTLNLNRLVVGASGDDGLLDNNNELGAVYLFTLGGSGFGQLAFSGTFGTGYGPQKNLDLLGTDNFNFGASVALLGRQLAIGVPGSVDATNSGTDVGAVYLFTFADDDFSGPTNTGIIGRGFSGFGNFDISVLQNGDRFGASVSLDGLRLAVGAPGDNGANNDTAAAGAVYLFSFNTTGFVNPTLEARVGLGYTGFKNVNVGTLEADDRFGTSVSLANTQLAVGAPGDDGAGEVANNTGAVHLFTFSNAIFNDGAFVGTIGLGYNMAVSDFNLTTLENGDRFGSAVAQSGFGLAVGAAGDAGFSNLSGADTGAVYTFLFADSDFDGPSLVGTLGSGYESGPGDGNLTTLEAGDLFGSALSFDGLGLVVGAPGDAGFDNLAGPNTGAVHLIQFLNGDLNFAQSPGIIGAGYNSGQFTSVPGLAAGDNFGSSVVLDKGNLIIGAAGDDGALDARFDHGAIYLLQYSQDIPSLFQSITLRGTIGIDYLNGATTSLAANGLAPGEEFASAVSLDGLRLAIGSPGDNGASNLLVRSGAVYLFTFSDMAFGAPVLQAVLGAGYSGGKNFSIGTLEANDGFGTSVSLDGDRLAVGAQGDDGADESQFDAGAVYLFSFADAMFSTTALQAIVGAGYTGGSNLSVANLESQDAFGRGVALRGDQLVVGAPGDDGDGVTTIDTGAVYFFTFSTSTFDSGNLAGIAGRGYFGFNDVDVFALEDFDGFGTSVSFDGGRLAVGAPFDEGNGNIGGGTGDYGAVYLLTFTDNQFGGSNLNSVIGLGYSGASNFDVSTLEQSDQFGISVSIEDVRLAVGANFDFGAFNTLNQSGAVRLFSFADTSLSAPVLEATIGSGYSGGKNIAVPLDFVDSFGWSVSLNENRLAVGALLDSGPGNSQPNPGAVYLFTFEDQAFNSGSLVGTIGAGYRSSVGLDLAAPLSPSFVQLDAGDAFGTAVSLDGNRLAIGAPLDAGSANGLTNAGAVYLFSFTDASFTGANLEAVIGHGYIGGKNLWPTNIDNTDQFGFSVSLDGNRLAVGAPRDDGFEVPFAEADVGAVYLFSFTDAMFSGGALEGIIGSGYESGKSLNLDTFDAAGALDPEDLFGTSVSLDGNRLAVGSPNDTGFNNVVAGNPLFGNGGAVYLFSFADATFSTPTLEARIGAGYSGGKNRDVLSGTLDRFGSAVALDGTNLVIGANGDDGLNDTIIDVGAVRLFTFSDLAFNGGINVGTIGADYDLGSNPFNISIADLAAGDAFGSSVSLQGQRLVVGAPGDDGFGEIASDSGAAYLIAFAGTDLSGGSVAGTIGLGYSVAAGSLDVSRIEDFDNFGASVSLDGARLAVGAGGDDGFANDTTDSGAVYLFTFADAAFGSPTLRTTIGSGYTRGVGTPVAGVGALDAFGTSVSLDGLRLAIGVQGDDGLGDSLTDSGAVYLFTFVTNDFEFPVLEGVIGNGYTGSKSLSVSGLRAGAQFGGAVSLQGLRLAVGAVGDRGLNDDTNGAGAVYLFGFGSDTFESPTQLGVIGRDYSGAGNLGLPLQGADQFGWSVSLDNDRLAVGATGDDGIDDTTAETGAVYLFDVTLDVPSLTGIIGRGYTGGANFDTTAFAGAGDALGSAVALDGTQLAVGASFEDGVGDSASNAGAVYLFTFADTAFNGATLAGTIGAGYDLSPPTSAANEFLGTSLSLDGNMLAVGAFGDTGNAQDASLAGAVYLISFADAAFASPSLTAIIGRGYTGGGNISVAGLEADDFFGSSVSIDDGRLVIGAPGDDGPENLVGGSGALYFFNLTGGTPETPGFGFGDNPGGDVTITPTALVDLLAAGTSVELQANNDITVSSPIFVSASGSGSNLTFRAGRSILINAGITTDGGNFTAIANESPANGVIDMFRDAGNAIISFGAGGFVDAGAGSVLLNLRSGSGLTNSDSGEISLGSITASSISVLHAGASGTNTVTVNSGAVLTASGPGDAIVVLSQVFNNLAGAGAFTFTGGGRFLVYASDYEDIDRGGLVGNNLYNRSFIDAAPGTVAQPGNLFIFQRQPILTFTADDVTRTYGDGFPDYSFQFAGLVNGDTAGYAFSGAPDLFDTASGNAGSDTIFIQQGTLLSDVGYGFDFVNGALTTLRALLTVQVDDKTREYGLGDPAFTATFFGLVNGDNETVVSGLNFFTLADITSDVGTYAISAFDASATNYDFAYVPGTLTITKALLTVTADDASREYGLANPTFTGSITGFRNADDASVISGLVYGSVATIASDVGTYAITGSGATSTNYDFAYTPGTLTITKALLTVAADDASREYGLASPAFTGSITGFRNADDASVISGLVYGSVATIASDVGTYAITGSGATSTNYDFAYTPGTLTITKALLTVAADDASREYGLANPAFTGSITGFRNSDDASVISGLVYGSVATIASDVGTYAITGSGATSTNYDFVYTPGTLTITKALLTVAADDANREYGLANPAFTGSITGFRNSDDASVISGLVYGSVATIASDGGTYAITGSGATSTNYDFSYTPGTLTITKALLTVAADDASREYGLANPAFTGSISGFRNADDASVISGLIYGSVATIASDVGTYAITGSGATSTNYDFSYTPGTLTITKALLTVAADDASREYGLANPAFTGSITGFRNSDTDSVVSGLVYGSVATIASDVGTYAITGSGATSTNYDFAYTPGTLTITKALLTVAADDASREYGLANPAFTGSITGFRNSDDASVISGLVYGSVATIASDVGTYAITGSGATSTNYDFSYTPGTLTITKALLTVTADDANREYGLANPAFTGSITGFRNSDDASVISGLVYGSVATIASDVGTYAITGSGATSTNYDFSYTPGTLTITKALLTVAADDASREYGLANPAFTGSISGFRNADDASVISGLIYGSVATIASDVGTYAITGSGATSTNYDFSYTPGTLTITKALLTVAADDASREYGLANPAFTGSITGFRNSDTDSVVSGLVYGSVATIASDVGTYAITGSGATSTNYDFAYTPGTLTITKALLTVTADDANREYGLVNPAFTGSITGFRNSDDASVITGLSYGSDALINSNVGLYAINASGASATNYDFAYTPGTLTITRALLTVTADDAAREYGLANPTFTGAISGLRAGDTDSVVSGLTFATVATIASDTGTYAITSSGASATNYDFAYTPGTLTITRALLTVTADSASREYGLSNPTFTGTISGLRNGDTASVISGLIYGSFATVASDVGAYAITGSGATSTNYDFAYTAGTLTITKALLTVTADDANREYGLANPAFTGSITGFRNSDDASVISGLLYGSVATIASDVGTYAITGSGGTSTNYDFAYTPGLLTITKALLTVTADSASREYGLANPAFTGTISGLRNGDAASVVTGLAYGSVATSASNVGTYAITGSGATSTNYDFAYTPGTLTITKALLTVTADDANREYGLANPAFTGSITGFRNADDASVISGLVYGSVATIASDVGTYAITGSGATSTNYDFAYTPGTLTITKALLTVTADDASREYGLANPAFTGSITGFRNSDDASVISGLVYGSVATIASDVGTYAIAGSGATSTNYDFAYTPGTLTITKALLTVTANDGAREYGLANPAFTGSIAGLRNGDAASVISGLVYSTAATAGSNVGTYAITGSGAAATNYDFAYVPGALTITRALLTVTADNATREYGLANPAFTGTISGLRNGDAASVVTGLAYGSVATSASNVGTYAITGSGATSTNYDFAYTPGNLTISKALLTVSADNAAREYGLANPTFTGTISGLRNGDASSVVSGLTFSTVATTGSNIGTYAITGSGAAATNYDFAYVPGALTITRALLTVTADNATREYGLANPAFTGTISGLRNGDAASVVTGLVYGSVATSASNVGTYAITGSGATSTNYDFAYVPGTLTISKALLTVTADNATREYGLANPIFTGTISGLRNGDSASVISGLVFGSVATTASNVGTYAITGSGASATNYDFAYAPGTLTITKALLTISADNKTREYGLTNPALTSSITGLRNGDTAAVVSGLQLATSATSASNVGAYAIGVSGGSALNYDFAYTPGTLAITPAPLTVTIDNKTRVYGGANPELTAGITGFRNGDTDAVVSGLRLRTGAAARSNVGDYVITGGGANAANYRFDYIPGTLSITKALLQVRVNNAAREYGLTNPAFSAMISGFRNGDTANVVSGLVLGSPAGIGSDVGIYAITASGASALNYDFAYTPGRLIIDQARLMITANSMVMHQGSGDPVLTVTYSGLRNGDAPDVVTGLVLRSSGGGTSSPGQYIINASRGTARNYQITYRPGVMTVLPALMPPASPPAAAPPAAAPPATTPPPTPPAATPPAVTPPPPTDGGTTNAPPASSGSGAGAGPGAVAGGQAPVTAPAGTPPPAAAAVQSPSASPAAGGSSVPGLGSVTIPVSPQTLPAMQVLQGLAAPLPVIVSPETRPADPADPLKPSQGNGQRTGCTYISLCSGTPVPLWTFQPAQ